MKNYIVLIAIAIYGLLFFSCESMDDYDLTETVYIEDPYSPGLPIYSEWGYNTFGAYIDRAEFKSSSMDIPSKIFIKNDTLRILMRGKLRNESADLTFSFPGLSYETYDQLIDLHDRSMDLISSGILVDLKKGNEPTELLDVFDGTFHIKRAQHLFIDEVPQRLILSGEFQFQTFYKGEPITISRGRFDLGYGYENFYNINR
jgi:hypothetical protein